MMNFISILCLFFKWNKIVHFILLIPCYHMLIIWKKPKKHLNFGTTKKNNHL
jgi:hypothetical protein